MPYPILYSLTSVIIVSLISFVGALTIGLAEHRLRNVLFLLVALATGALLGDAFIHLIPQAYATITAPNAVSLLIILGILLFFGLEKTLQWHPGHGEEGHAGHMREAEDRPVTPIVSSVGRLILVSDGFHNFLDGIIIGVSYLAGIEVGIATTIAVVLHEIPQEIGDFGVLLHSGYRVRQALLYNFISALTAIAGVLLVIFVGEALGNFIKWTVPLAAGAFIYIAAADLVPELHRNKGLKNFLLEGLFIAIGIGAMYLLLFME